MHIKISPRLSYLFGFFTCAGLLGFALYLQYFQNQDPCSLCILQRGAFIALMVIFLIAGLHNPKKVGAYIYGFLILLFAGLGAALAGRQIWIQHLPKDKIPECGRDLYYMLENFPLKQTLETVLRGSGECAERGWSFLGLVISEWSLLFFILLGLLGIGLTALIHRREWKAKRPFVIR